MFYPCVACAGLYCLCRAGSTLLPRERGIPVRPHPCELTFDIPPAIHSLTNYAHIVLFALLFVMTCAQLGMSLVAALLRDLNTTLVGRAVGLSRLKASELSSA